MKKLLLIACAVAGLIGSAFSEPAVYSTHGCIGYIEQGHTLISATHGYVGSISNNGSILSLAQGYIGYVDEQGNWQLNDDWFF